MTSQTKKRSDTAWYFAAAIIVTVIIIGSGLTYQYAQPSHPSSPLTSPSASGSPSAGSATIAVYAGELSTSVYGFGSTTSNITSPGPTFTVKVGTKVTVNFNNVGTMSHNFAIVAQKTSGNTNLAFSKAQVASAGYPVPPNGKASTTFVANQIGTFYYICQVDAHVTLGMWGYFNVTQ